jgi:hypothetical protein
MVPATSKTVENSHFMVLVTNRRIHKEVEMFCDCGVPIKKENRVFGFGKNRVFGFAKNRVFGFGLLLLGNVPWAWNPSQKHLSVHSANT